MDYGCCSSVDAKRCFTTEQASKLFSKATDFTPTLSGELKMNTKIIYNKVADLTKGKIKISIPYKNKDLINTSSLSFPFSSSNITECGYNYFRGVSASPSTTLYQNNHNVYFDASYPCTADGYIFKFQKPWYAFFVTDETLHPLNVLRYKKQIQGDAGADYYQIIGVIAPYNLITPESNLTKVYNIVSSDFDWIDKLAFRIGVTEGKKNTTITNGAGFYENDQYVLSNNVIKSKIDQFKKSYEDTFRSKYNGTENFSLYVFPNDAFGFYFNNNEKESQMKIYYEQELAK